MLGFGFISEFGFGFGFELGFGFMIELGFGFAFELGVGLGFGCCGWVLGWGGGSCPIFVREAR